MRSMGGNITTDCTEIKMISKYLKLCVNKFDNLGEVEKFLKRHKLPKLPPKEIDKKKKERNYRSIQKKKIFKKF